jgi:hypothetical protein
MLRLAIASSTVFVPTKVKTSVPSGGAVITYAPSFPVVVAIVVPFTVTVTKGSGLPSSALVTFPVTLV